VEPLAQTGNVPKFISRTKLSPDTNDPIQKDRIQTRLQANYTVVVSRKLTDYLI